MAAPSLVGPSLLNVERILVVHTRGGMGDVLLTTPVLQALQERYPRAPIDMMVRGGAAPMVSNHPALADVLVVPEGDLDHAKTFTKWVTQVRDRKYSLGLVLWNKFPEALLLYQAGVRHRVGQDSRVLYSWMFTRRVRIRSEHGDEQSHAQNPLEKQRSCQSAFCDVHSLARP